MEAFALSNRHDHGFSPYAGLLVFAATRQPLARNVPVHLSEERPPMGPQDFCVPEAAAAAENEGGRWNHTCIGCHTTYGRLEVKGVDGLDDTWKLIDADTRVAEFGISCEACHDPGEEHVRANLVPIENGVPAPVDSIVHPGTLSHQLSSQICGQCHGIFAIRREKVFDYMSNGYEYRPGQDLADSSLRNLVRCSGESVSDFPKGWETAFWSDGMVRVSGREYNGLVESPCFQRGELSCISCRQMHQSADDLRPVREWANDQLAVEMDGNKACVQCHREFEHESAVASHTHHSVESAGSSCYNCHMSYTTYGLLKAIHSQQIDSPDVAVSIRTGRPNACNQCHFDRTLAWSTEHLSDWYGIDAPELTDDQKSVAASVLWLLRGDAGQRALMGWSYGWDDARAVSGSEWMAPYLGQLLQDLYDAVRYIAYHSLRRLPGFESFDFDFVGDPRFRPAASQQVLELWSRRRRAIEGNRAGIILFDEFGEIQTDKFNRLLEQRDDRPVMLNE